MNSSDASDVKTEDDTEDLLYSDKKEGFQLSRSSSAHSLHELKDDDNILTVSQSR